MSEEAQRILYLEADVETGHDLLAKAVERTQFVQSQLAAANKRISQLEIDVDRVTQGRDESIALNHELEAEIARLRDALELVKIVPRPWMAGATVTWPEWDSALEKIEAALKGQGDAGC